MTSLVLDLVLLKDLICGPAQIVFHPQDYGLGKIMSRPQLCMFHYSRNTHAPWIVNVIPSVVSGSLQWPVLLNTS